jgi:hypothetical protein
MVEVMAQIEAKDVNRGLRGTLWPALRAHGFTERTERVAWRYTSGAIDVVELQAVGRYAEAVGCPGLSLSVFVAAYPPYLPEAQLVGNLAASIPTRAGRLRPHYWHCDPFNQSMEKTLSQPWFRSFSRPMNQSRPLAFRLHEEALRRLTSRATHDRPDVWYLREDGSNLDDNLRDMTRVVLTVGLELLDQWNDPRRVLEQLEGKRQSAPESPGDFYLREAIQDYLSSRRST